MSNRQSKKTFQPQPVKAVPAIPVHFSCCTRNLWHHQITKAALSDAVVRAYQSFMAGELQPVYYRSKRAFAIITCVVRKYSVKVWISLKQCMEGVRDRSKSLVVTDFSVKAPSEKGKKLKPNFNGKPRHRRSVPLTFAGFAAANA